MSLRLLIAILAAGLPTFGPVVCGFMCPGSCGPIGGVCCGVPAEAVVCCGDSPCAPSQPAAPCCEVCPCDEPAPVPQPSHLPPGLELPVAILNRPWPTAAADRSGHARLALRASPAWSPGGGNPIQSVLCIWLI